VTYSSKGNFVYVAVCVSNKVAAGLPTAFTVLSSAEALPVSLMDLHRATEDYGLVGYDAV
jgi:hypothetical protein